MIWPGQAFEHDADHCEADEGGDGCRITFEVATETTVTADPCEGSLHDPSFWHDDEAMKVGALDDLDLPASGGDNRSRHFWSLISRVGEDAFDERKTPPHTP